MAGDYIAVEIGGNGDVIGLFKVWRIYTPYKEYAIITPREAYIQLIEREPTFPTTPGTPVSINRVYLAYVTKAPA